MHTLISLTVMPAAPPSDTFVTCSGCGTTNRIPRQSGRGRPICGACRIPLLPQEYVPPAEPFSIRLNRFVRRHYSWTILFVIVGIGVWQTNRPSSPSHYQPPTSTKYSPPVPPTTFSEPTLPLPTNGALQVFTTRQAIAPFEIKSSYGGHYLVKLVDSYSKTPVITVFVHGGLTANVDVPLGTYEVRYASGDTWYGYEHLFGPDTAYSKADQMFYFRDDGSQVSGYTITLYKVRNGNLQTSKIRKNQF